MLLRAQVNLDWRGKYLTQREQQTYFNKYILFRHNIYTTAKSGGGGRGAFSPYWFKKQV